MARTINFSAPESMRLTEMSSDEIEKQVSELSERALDLLGEDARPIGVNAVALSQVMSSASDEFKGWVEWTRACAKTKARIDDYTDPVVEQFEADGRPVRADLAGQPLESQLRVQRLRGQDA